MQEIINYLTQNGIEFEKTKEGLSYEGYYKWYYIYDKEVQNSENVKSFIKRINNNCNH